jgi:tRNA G18 (ribose-2'-O)-methylase SpoU
VKQLQNKELQRPDLATYKAAEKLPVHVVLDNVRSGLNVGAIFRTCDAFAVQSVYLCGITAQPPHAEIMKTALGATESVSWKYTERTTDALHELLQAGWHIIAVEQTDQSVSLEDVQFNTHFPVALVFGNEMRGISPDVLQLCTSSLEIPQAGIKHSLNVATSAGIILWECYRQFLRLRFLSSTA